MIVYYKSCTNYIVLRANYILFLFFFQIKLQKSLKLIDLEYISKPPAITKQFKFYFFFRNWWPYLLKL